MQEQKGDKAWLEAKWWYRFLKVIFIGFFLLSSFFVIGAASQEFPKKHEDFYHNLVTCKNGRSFEIHETSILQFDPFSERNEKLKNLCFYGSEIEEIITDVGDPRLKFARRVVWGNASDFHATLIEIPEDIYTIEDGYVTTGSMKDFLGVLIIGMGIMATIAIVIRGSFYYITIGKFFPK